MQKLDPSQLSATLPMAFNSDRRSGGSLLMIMVIVIAVSLLGLAIMGMVGSNGIEMVRGQQAKQAFCLAEAGLYHAIARLRTDIAYRDNPSVISNAMGAGYYTVSIQNLTNITSQARVGNSYRTLQMNVKITTNGWIAANAAMLGGGKIHYNGNDTTITGDVIAGGDVDSNPGNAILINGNLITAGNVALQADSVVSGTVQVPTGKSVFPSTLPQSPPPDPIPTPTDWSAAKANYDTLIAYAKTNGQSPINLSTTNLFLNSITNYYNGNMLQSDTPNKIYGPGVLVASGDINLYAIASNVTIVAGGQLQFGSGNSPASFPIANSTFYSGATSATKPMLLQCPNMALSNCVLMSAGGISARAFDMKDTKSVFLALGSINFGQGNTRFFTSQGRFEAGLDFTVAANTSFTLSRTDLPTLPPGFTGTVIIQKKQWINLGANPF